MGKVNFARIEKKWQDKWEKSKIFEVKGSAKGKKHYVLEMYPYPSGSGLHIGHAFNYTIGDIYARFKRMQGFNVLYPMGYDSFGLPAENAAIRDKSHPKKFTEDAIKNYIRQQRELGLSYDWSRKVECHTPEFYKWDQWIFLKMLEKGLAYRKAAPVNWCGKCNTVLANEQVKDGKCYLHEDTEVELKHLEQWFLKITDYADELYESIEKLKDWPEDIKAMQRNWINKKEGYIQNYKVNDMNLVLETFTTHHHTSFAEIFIAIAPEHPVIIDLVKGTKYEKGALEFVKKVEKNKAGGRFEYGAAKDGYFTGRYVRDFCSGRDLPIYIADFAMMDFGTGIVKASCHDERDFDFAKTHGIKLYEVLFPNKLVENKSSKGTEYEIVHPGLDEKKMSDYSYDGSYNEKVIGKVDVTFEGDTAVIGLIISGDVFDKTLQERSAIRQLWFNYFSGKIKKMVVKLDGLSSGVQDMEDMDFVFSDGKYELKKGNEKIPESYDGQGYMFDSGQFTGLSVPEAKKKMGEWMTKKGYAKKTVVYGLRDWLVSRQRFWGTPIPIIYCDKCGAVPVSEKDLPVKLPEDIKFTSEENPLKKYEKFTKAKCPKCGGQGRRETDTMDTFVNSSWYFLRYCDPKNEKAIFDKKKVKHWMPVDLYVGGREHATGHLIYSRFYTKFLRDLGLLDFDEPAQRLFNQGMVHGENGEKMSKSKGNVVLPEEVSKKYGIDSARLFLMSLGGLDKNRDWSDKGAEGSLRFIEKIIGHVENVKVGKSSEKTQHKVNKAIKDVSEDIENLKYNLAVIKLRELFEGLDSEIAKKDLESVVKLLSPFAPHIAEQLWEKIGNKPFVSLADWPKCDEKKINKKFDKIDQAVDKTVSDILNILKILEVKGGSVEKVYVYVLPNEVEFYSGEEIGKRVGKEVRVFAVNDKEKHDPENKAKKVKPGRPGIFVE
ncbi:MAG: leucine--tRNA ligase [archaeon]